MDLVIYIKQSSSTILVYATSFNFHDDIVRCIALVGYFIYEEIEAEEKLH